MASVTRANCFDASALVKVFVDEPDCGPARIYFNTESPTKYTTPFCYFETLSVLKSKWLYRKDISREIYLKASFALTVWFKASSRKISDLDLADPSVFDRALQIVDKHNIDVSDAFQILSIKEGYFSPLAKSSKTLLITADEKLQKVAELEGVTAWYCLRGRQPG